MKHNTSIQLKAGFLLIIFALNTIVGFACAMGLKSPDVKVKKEIKVHVHADGKKHHHESSSTPKDHHQKEEKKSKKNGCCNTEVLKFQNLDKSINQNTKVFAIPFFTAIASIYLDIEIIQFTEKHSAKFYTRYFHPPPPNILIENQRFQI